MRTGKVQEMRLPNGFGSVHKLPGKRRKPWRARVTVGWVMVDKDGQTVPDDSEEAVDNKQVYKTVGYYAKRQEALAALMAYRGEEPEQEALTFAEVLFAGAFDHHDSMKILSHYLSPFGSLAS
jgi:hypothetical protein